MPVSRHVTFPLSLIFAAFTLAACTPGNSQPLPEVVVYKTSTCGCCKLWVNHMEDAGFKVTSTDLQDLSDIKEQHGVSPELRSCHTAIVDGYVVEGHVPADVIQRMLREKPDIVGISAPGMPIGSPGMEVEGQAPQRYNVVAFDKNGATSVYAQR